MGPEKEDLGFDIFLHRVMAGDENWSFIVTYIDARL